MSNKLDRNLLFNGFISNQEINDLEDESELLKTQIKDIEKKITDIQSKCDHHYTFWSSGVYNDYYVCDICRHEIEQ